MTYEITQWTRIAESGGWLHQIVATIGNNKVVVDDDTDYVVATSDGEITKEQVAAIWRENGMGTSMFGHNLPSDAMARNPASCLDNLVWEDTGEALSGVSLP